MKRPYALIDLHCDTLTDCMYQCVPGVDTLNDPRRTLSLDVLPCGVHWGQFYAIFTPDSCRGQAAIDFFQRHCASFYRQMKKYAHQVAPCRGWRDLEQAWARGKTAAFLTLESGAPLAGRLERVGELARAGVRCITLTWNGENELGSGNLTDKGLTPFGRAAVGEMERQEILVDVSHLNDRGLCDLLETAGKPFLATHSNARALCGHPRNLTDWQLKEMFRRGCLVGLNYYVRFLREDGRVESLDDIYRHAMHMLELGGERCVALGSDYDGSDVPPCLDTPEKAAGLFDYLLGRGMSQRLAEGVLYQNALDFLRANLQA